MEISNRKSVFTELSEFDHHAVGRADFMEVTTWSNDEGFDIHISDAMGNRIFQMTDGQWKALKKAVKALYREDNDLVKS